MKLLIALIIFVMMSINVAMADTIPNSALPPCEGEGCYIVAEKIALKETTDTKGLKIRTGLFGVIIPSNLISISSSPQSSLTVYRYENRPSISICTETDHDYLLRGLTTKPPSIQAFMEIVYAKVPKDFDVTGTYDKETWNALMWLKKLIVEKNSKIYIYERGSLKIYYETGIDREPSRNAAWAIDSDNPNLALRLESNMDAADFKTILLSITTKTRGK